MSNTTPKSKQNLFLNFFDKNLRQNKEFCINCEKKNDFLNVNCENNNVILNKNVQTNLHKTHKNFLYIMEEILCLCKQHDNL